MNSDRQTGRFSSSKPNLQNIPLRTAEARKIRNAFVRRPKWQKTDFNYETLELRILAEMLWQEES